MGSVISIDFGTTNTVVAEWVESRKAPSTILLDGLSRRVPDGPPSIPSLLFIDDAETKAYRFGYTVISFGLTQRGDANERLFTSMKRAFLDPQYGKEYRAGNVVIDSKKAAQIFLDAVCQGVLATGRSISELVLTVPVMSFEPYLRWLASAIQQFSLPEGATPRIIDEPTAAAFGYGIDNPGGIVLVIDFGGGTLDLSLVRLPLDSDTVGRGVVIRAGSSPEVALAANRDRLKARVMGKTYRKIGGDDIDAVFVDRLLEQENLTRSQVLDDLPALTRMVEDAKITLSKLTQTDVHSYLRSQRRFLHQTVTTSEFESQVLKSRRLPVLDILRDSIAEILAQGEKKEIGEHQIDHVLLVGGTSLIPAIRQMVVDRFGTSRIMQRKPFEAVAHGALVLATAHPLEDILQHSYALEVKRTVNDPGRFSEFDYIPMIEAGSLYPFDKPMDLSKYYLKPMADHVREIDFVIAEVEQEKKPGNRVVYDANGKVLTDRGQVQVPRGERIRLLRNNCYVTLDPPGMFAQHDRLDVSFYVDENRRLFLTVWDRLANRYLMRNEPVTRLE